VVDAPRFVQRCKHVALNDLVAGVAKVSKQLVVVCFTVGQSLAFIMSVSKERFFTLCTHEVFHVPVFSQCCHNTLFDRTSASSADRNTHLVMTSQAVELVQLVSCVSRARAHLSSTACQLDSTTCAIKVVWMVDLSTESKRFSVNGTMALLTHVLPDPVRLHLRVALVAQSSTLIFDEAEVGKLLVTHLAREALCVPGGLHRFDDPTNDEFAAFLTAGRKQDVEIMFAVLAPLELVEHAVRERTKALGAHEAPRVEQFTIRVDNLLLRLEPVVASCTRHRVQVRMHVPTQGRHLFPRRDCVRRSCARNVALWDD